MKIDRISWSEGHTYLREPNYVHLSTHLGKECLFFYLDFVNSEKYKIVSNNIEIEDKVIEDMKLEYMRANGLDEELLKNKYIDMTLHFGGGWYVYIENGKIYEDMELGEEWYAINEWVIKGIIE
jgi:hypothetical protein